MNKWFPHYRDSEGIVRTEYELGKRRGYVETKMVCYSDFDRNCCTVTAFAAVTPWSYSEAHQYLEEEGRKRNQGFRTMAFFDFILMPKRKGVWHGVRFIEVYNHHSHGKHHLEDAATQNGALTLGRFMATKPQGNYLVIVRGHATAVIDGVLHDSEMRSARLRIKRIYRTEMA